MAKELLYYADARAALAKGVEKLARAVRTTLGPKGRTAVLDKGWGTPTITKDGVTVAEEVELTNRFENMGAQMVKEAASKTSDQAGDGTTTATVLAESIFAEGLRFITSGASEAAVKRGIDLAVKEVIEQLVKLAQPVKGKKEINQVATIASNNDVLIGKMISEAMEKVGKDGVITVEEGKSAETTVDVVEGMQFDRGFLSPHFVTDPEAMKVVLENPYILIHEDKIASVKKLIPLLELVSRQKRSLLIIAEDVEGEALATMVVNRIRGIIQCAAVKAPGYGDRRKDMLEDIAVLTGGKAVFKDLGIDMEKIKPDTLGTAKKVEITSEKTTIISGGGSAADMSGRAKLIRKTLEDTESDYDKEKLQERLAKLTGGVAQLNVGAATEAEMKERKARVEDALHATRAAVEEGILPGGGVALLRASSRLSSLKLEGDEALGAEAVRKALEAPARWIAQNAGANGAVIVKKIMDGKGAFGFNADKMEFGDMIEMGIIDPTKVARTALLNAASVAGMLLSADALVATAPKKDDEEEEEEGGGMPPM